MTDNAIEVSGVGKRFNRHVDRRNSIRERIVRGKARRNEDFWALRDLSLEIPKGSWFGLIGHNGSGKSTLLKLLSGIYRPTNGQIRTEGRVAALIELGAGFHPDMTGRENIALNGAILGLSKKEIREATDEIIDFSGLREFIDDPVKHYSSGMYVRLGFAVAVHMKPDILLVDEVLAVGDEEFQRKCFDYLARLRREGRTIVLVTHSLAQVESLCDQAAWLEHGTLQAVGHPSDVTAAYLKRVNSEEAARNPLIVAERLDGEEPRAGDGRIRVRSARLTDLDGQTLSHAETGSTFAVRLGLHASEEVLGPNVRLAFQHDTGPLVTMISNHRSHIDLGYVNGELELQALVLDNPLLPGRYRVHVDVFDHTGAQLHDSWNDVIEFAVRSQGGEIGQGFVQLPADFRIS